jgi:lysophospholipase L1-like esterase
MNKKNLRYLSIGLAVLLVLSGIAVFLILSQENKKPLIRVACVGDSLTQSTAYPYDLWMLLGTEKYNVSNFGAGSRTVLLNSQTPYTNTSMFQEALEFEPNIVIIMLGTNDAQPSLVQYNTSFVGDYLKLIDAFKGLSSQPKIWIVLPPPIFNDQGGKILPDYFNSTIIPDIEQAANESNLPVINVYSALANASDDFPDGVHPDGAGAKLIADTIYAAITSQNVTNTISLEVDDALRLQLNPRPLSRSFISRDYS